MSYAQLAEIGHSVGIRMLELSSLREKTGFKREIKIVGILSYIKDTIWKVTILEGIYIDLTSMLGHVRQSSRFTGASDGQGG
eukprot:756732-Hanusia_phi.AAC.16